MLGARKANIVREEPRFLRSKMKLGDRNPLTNETITVICLNLGGKKRDFIFEQFDSKTQHQEPVCIKGGALGWSPRAHLLEGGCWGEDSR
jgi:hypothetical protein